MNNDSEFMAGLSLLFLRWRWESRKQIPFKDNAPVKYINLVSYKKCGFAFTIWWNRMLFSFLVSFCYWLNISYLIRYISYWPHIIRHPGPGLFRKTFLKYIFGRSLSLREIITQTLKVFKGPIVWWRPSQFADLP